MQKQSKNNDFARFLKDERFIDWKLCQTDELCTYWLNYLEQHPDELKDFQLAEEYFKKNLFADYTIPQERKERAIKHLEQSLRKHTRKRKSVVFAYVAAACVSIMVLTMVLMQRNNKKLQEDTIVFTDYIVGSELEDEDIRLITQNQETSFAENVDIELNNEGLAEVTTNSSAKTDVRIDNKALNRLIVPHGKRSTLLLADGSKVWLNSGTILEFPTVFSGNRRELSLLSGEIYIEVANNPIKTFYVNTQNFKVKVHGTKFNISTYDESSQSIVLVEGSISLKSASNNETLLLPNEIAVYNSNETFSTKRVNVDEFISWKSGYLSFNKTPITEMMKQIGRYYNISFNYDKEVNLQKRTCTGKIYLSKNIDDVMTTLGLITSTKYERENNQIYIINEDY